MQFEIKRDILLKSLNFVQGVVEKKNIAKEINAYDKSKEVSSYLSKNFEFKI